MNDESFELAMTRQWALAPTESGDDLVSELAKRVAWLMKHDYERLLNAVYLLDVPERRFRHAAAMSSKDDAARAVAELILERERQKFESRQRYRRERSTDVPAEDVGD